MADPTYRLFRVLGTSFTSTSVVDEVLPIGPATNRIDFEPLPDGQQFGYAAQALSGIDDKSGLSILAIVTAQNDKPVAVADDYDGGDIVAGVVVGNLFANDTDVDFGFLVDTNGDGVLGEGDVPDKSRWTAVDAAGGPLAVPGLVFTGDPGAFTYDPSEGSVTFDYRVDTGNWFYDDETGALVDSGLAMSEPSNIVTVTITLFQVTFEPLKERARLGSDVNVTFEVTTFDGTIISDLNVVEKFESVFDDSITCAPLADGLRAQIFTPGTADSGNSDLRILRNNGSFRLNWDTTEGTPDGAGCYKVIVTLNGDAEFITPTTVELVEGGGGGGGGGGGPPVPE